MAHTTQTVIRPNSKGATVWIQDLAKHGWSGGTLYTTEITQDAIIYTKATPETTGKVRKVTASKGGIIDNTSKKVLTWAQGATEATVHIGTQRIHIERA